MKRTKARSKLEDHVLKYSPGLGERVEQDQVARARLERILDETYATYEPFVERSVPGKVVRGAGKTSGYLGDLLWASAYFVPGWSIPGAGFKLASGLAQLPGKVYKSISYAAKTGDYLGAAENFLTAFTNFVPYLTVLDRGLAKISQKRMAKSALYRVQEELGVEGKKWHTRAAEEISGDYVTAVKDRSANVISPHYTPGLETAAVAA